jgi:hypothetical protein
VPPDAARCAPNLNPVSSAMSSWLSGDEDCAMAVQRETESRRKILPFVKPTRTCSICGKFIPLAKVQTDEQGNFVHEPCLAMRSSSRLDRKHSR